MNKAVDDDDDDEDDIMFPLFFRVLFDRRVHTLTGFITTKKKKRERA